MSWHTFICLRVLQNHDSFQPCADGGALCELQHSAGTADRRKSKINRRYLSLSLTHTHTLTIKFLSLLQVAVSDGSHIELLLFLSQCFKE